MSPEERARAAFVAWGDGKSDTLVGAIAAAIRAAVAAETERCAGLVDTMAAAVVAQPFADSLRALARGVRATGPAGTPPP